MTGNQDAIQIEMPLLAFLQVKPAQWIWEIASRPATAIDRQPVEPWHGRLQAYDDIPAN